MSSLMSDHVTLEQLNDMLDQRLSAWQNAQVQAHAASCLTCARELSQLQTMLRSASALPSEVAPPPELWTNVRHSIDALRVATIAPTPRSARMGWNQRALGVAAVALVIVSSGTTAVVMSRRANAPASPMVLASTAWHTSEASYVQSAQQLRDQLDEIRGELSPATIATVERSLRVIDDAIAEARSALAADPANAAITDLLASNYRHKIELLRRATQLDQRS